MRQKFTKMAAIAGLPLLMSACVDNDYDLSNIDTTSEIKVTDLVIPVNIDAITLSDIFDIDDESEIKPVTINGQEFYAVTKHGDISSQSIDIPTFTAPSPTIKESVAEFVLVVENPTTRAALSSVDFFYDLRDFTPQHIEISAGVDEAIKEIKEVDAKPIQFSVTFRETELPSYVTLYVEKLDLEILKGLKLQNLPSNYSYDPTSGVLSLNDMPCPNKTLTVNLTAIGADFTKSNTQIQNGSFNYSGDVKLISGRLKATVDLNQAAANFSPETLVHFSVNTHIGDLEATNFTGTVEYHLTGSGLDIAPVDLTGIPDFLNQEGTDLKLANPQIYLNLNNPVADYNLYYQTGLQLTAVNGDNKTPYSPDNGKLIATEPLNPGPYNFQLSPEATEPLPDYANGIRHIPFSGLSNLLSGDKIPDQIEINLINPELPYQTVNKFELGKPIPGISGSYDLVAPIALKSGSKIVYGDTKDGWNDEDIDKLTINTLQVDADVTSTIPMSAHLVAYPLDTQGHRIPGVTAECTIPANANGEHITLQLQGTIQHLDGITFEATLTPGSENPLAPDQTIKLANLRAKVSGSYTTDF